MLDHLGVKDILDWTVPIAITWVGSGVRKYLKGIQQQMQEAKESIGRLNLQIAKLLERVDSHAGALDDHEHRIRHVEQKKR